MQIAYGHEIKSDNDRYVQLAKEIDDSIERISGSTALQLFPFGKHRAFSPSEARSDRPQRNTFRPGSPVPGLSVMHRVKNQLTWPTII